MPTTLIGLRGIARAARRSATATGMTHRRRRDARRRSSRDRARRATRIAALWQAARAGRDAAPAQHGHARRQPLPRHALQLLRPELRVAQGDRLLHEEGRRDLLGRDREPACLAVSSTDTAPALLALGATVTLVSRERRRARSPLADLYRERRHPLPDAAARRDPHRRCTLPPTRTAGAAPTGSCAAAARSTFPVLGGRRPPRSSTATASSRRAHRARRGRVAAARRGSRPRLLCSGQRLTDEVDRGSAAAAARAAPSRWTTPTSISSGASR